MTLPKPTERTKAKNLRILVVDDEQDICKVLNKYFSDKGHNVRCADNGTEAIKLLKSESFDLALCDLVMPEISGRDVIKELNTLDKRPKVGLMTGWSENIQLSHEEGLKVDFIVKKPFSFSELSKKINDVFFYDNEGEYYGIFTIKVFVLCAFGITGCKKEVTAEKAGKEVDHAINAAKEKLDEATK